MRIIRLYKRPVDSDQLATVQYIEDFLFSINNARLSDLFVVCVGKEVLAMERRILQSENRIRKRGLASDGVSDVKPLSLCQGVIA